MNIPKANSNGEIKKSNANKQLSTTADIAPSDPPTLTSKPPSQTIFCVRATELRFSQVFVGLDLWAQNAYRYSKSRCEWKRTNKVDI